MQMDSMTNKVCCVINAILDLSKIDRLSEIGLQYYLILHDKDVDDNGVLKTEHYHLILVRSTRSRVKWFYNRVLDAFGINGNQLSIQVCDSLPSSVQYLIHKNDSKKYQYNPFDIKTNDTQEHLMAMLSKDLSVVDMDFEYLESIAVSCGFDLCLIMKTIGLGRYNAFRNTIKDFLNFYKRIYKQKLMKDDIIANGLK